MKNTLLIVFLNLIAMNNLTGQEAEIIRLFNQLEERGILTETEKTDLLRKDCSTVAKNEINAYVLKEVAFLQNPDVFLSAKSDRLTADQESNTEENTTKISEDLIDLGLISEELLAQWKASIKDQDGQDSKQLMLMFYAYKLAEIKKVPEQKNALDRLVSTYMEAGLLAEHFQKEYDTGKISIAHPVELIAFIKHGEVLKLKDFPTDIYAGYSEIYQRLNDNFEEIDLELMEFKVEAKPAQNPKKVIANTLVKIDEEAYRDTFKYNYIGNKNTLQNVMLTSFNPNIIHSINEGLRKKDSEFRLYYIDSYDIGYSKDKVGMVYLTKDQYHVIKKNKQSINLHGPNPSEHLSPAIVKNMLREAKAIGLIHENTEVSGKELLIKEFSDIFHVFQLLYKKTYQVEESSNYSDILKAYAKVIGEEFTLEIEKEIWDSTLNIVYLDFSVNGKAHQLELKIDGIKIDKQFRQKLETILKSLNLKKQLATVGIYGKELGIGYFNEGQIDWLKTNGTGLWIAEE